MTDLSQLEQNEEKQKAFLDQKKKKVYLISN